MCLGFRGRTARSSAGRRTGGTRARSPNLANPGRSDTAWLDQALEARILEVEITRGTLGGFWTQVRAPYRPLTFFPSPAEQVTYGKRHGDILAIFRGLARPC